MDNEIIEYINIDLSNKEDLKKFHTKKEGYYNYRVIEGDITSLESIKEIYGSLEINNSSFKSFGELIAIHGSLRISSVCSQIEDTGNIEYIDGEALLKFSKIKSISKLEFVKGDLHLRNTLITSLNNLKYVGGNLYLPKRLKNKISIESITVEGKVRYYEDFIKKNNNVNYVNSEIRIPVWNECSYELSFENTEQKEFYEYFKTQFFNGSIIDIKNNFNYVYALEKELLQLFKNTEENKYEALLNLLANSFEEVFISIIRFFKFYYKEKNDYNKSYLYFLKYDILEFDQLPFYVYNFKKNILDNELAIRISGKNILTDFGKKNINEILPFISKNIQSFEYVHNKEFFDVFFDYPILYKKLNNSDYKNITYLRGYDPFYYKEFFLTDFFFEESLRYDTLDEKNNYHRGITNIVENAIRNQLRKILIKSENDYRLSIGMPKISEGWISETELFYKISSSFPSLKVIHHGRPIWLGKQHLDIYIPELKLAFEYQGLQHETAVDFFGGEEGLKKTKERDKRKRELCTKNSIALIYVYPMYDFESIKYRIQEQLIKQCNE
jgi:hypothetical protein